MKNALYLVNIVYDGLTGRKATYYCNGLINQANARLAKAEAGIEVLSVQGT